MKTIDKPVLVLVGPTAIGKTSLSLQIAKRYDCEIISVDSMQVYRYMDIGTAKVSKAERAECIHHLIDVVNPDEDYNAARFARECFELILQIHDNNKIPVLTGGTGLYLRALFEGIFPEAPANTEIRNNLRERLDREGCSKLHEELAVCDPVSAGRIHQNDSHRLLRALEVFLLSGKSLSEHIDEHARTGASVKFTNTLKIGLTCPRQTLYDRINRRCEMMIEEGLEEEVRRLLTMGFDENLKSMQSIGYRHMLNYLRGDWSMSEMKELLARDTRRYAKRQYTWFGKTAQLKWYQVNDQDSLLTAVSRWLP